MPWFLRLVTIVRARSMSANNELSVISITSRSAGKAGLRENTHDALREPAVGKLRRRDVDGDLQRRVPARRLAQRFADHLLRQAPDQSDFLGDRNENVRPDDPGQRVIPAREDLETHDLACREVHLRLEERHELAVLEAEADALLDLTLGNQRALHAGIEPDGPRDPAAPRMIQRNVGTAQQVRNPRFRRRGRSNPSESADLDDPLVESEWTRDRSEQLLSHLLGFGALSGPSARAIANSSPLNRAMTASWPSSSFSAAAMLLSNRSPIS